MTTSKKLLLHEGWEEFLKNVGLAKHKNMLRGTL